MESFIGNRPTGGNTEQRIRGRQQLRAAGQRFCARCPALDSAVIRPLYWDSSSRSLLDMTAIIRVGGKFGGRARRIAFGVAAALIGCGSLPAQTTLPPSSAPAP